MKKRIKTKILVITLLILIFNIGLIARIDNSILSVSYVLALALLGNVIRKRIEVR